MKKVYEVVDEYDHQLTAVLEDGELRVTMTFYPDDLTIEGICDEMGWRIIEEKVYHKPEIVLLRKD
jgi:hypothetical protein